MISIAACAGYKYYGGKLPLTKDSPWYEYRDNMTYLSIGFSDWTNDQEMLRFVVENHVPYFNFNYLVPHIQQYVEDNQTPLIHLLFMQDDNFDGGGLKFWIGLEMPEVDQDEHGPETAIAHIERKQAFYAGELARREAEIQAEEERQEGLTQGRNERRLIKEAKKLLGPK